MEVLSRQETLGVEVSGREWKISWSGVFSFSLRATVKPWGSTEIPPSVTRTPLLRGREIPVTLIEE